jgi:hypothetical protein
MTLEHKSLKCKKPVIDRLFFGGGGEIRTHDISLANRSKGQKRPVISSNNRVKEYVFHE